MYLSIPARQIAGGASGCVPSPKAHARALWSGVETPSDAKLPIHAHRFYGPCIFWALTTFPSSDVASPRLSMHGSQRPTDLLSIKMPLGQSWLIPNTRLKVNGYVRCVQKFLMHPNQKISAVRTHSIDLTRLHVCPMQSLEKGVESKLSRARREKHISSETVGDLSSELGSGIFLTDMGM
ncbi:unnamed protein product [Sympodiomycopsis kandeliae]